MNTWIAEYTRGPYLFNVREFKATSKEDAECQAWVGYMQLADCLTVSVRMFVAETTALSERKDQKKIKVKRMAA